MNNSVEYNPTIYLCWYNGGKSFVLRTALPEGKYGPSYSYSDKNCPPFSEFQKELIKSIAKGTHMALSCGENGSMKSGRGWYNFYFWKGEDTQSCYEKIIMGCLANNIELIIIEGYK